MGPDGIQGTLKAIPRRVGQIGFRWRRLLAQVLYCRSGQTVNLLMTFPSLSRCCTPRNDMPVTESPELRLATVIVSNWVLFIDLQG